MLRQLNQLAQQLSDLDPATRRAAAEQLNAMGEDVAPVIVSIIRALEDEDEPVREYANSALEGAGPPPQETVDELEQLLASPNPSVAYWAATLLGRLKAGAVQAVEALKSAAAEHPSDEVRKRATWALGKIASG